MIEADARPELGNGRVVPLHLDTLASHLLVRPIVTR